MAYWLLKSEPDVYAYDQLVAEKIGHWDGVRNYQAANNLKAMTIGDEFFFYHSNIGREIVGIGRIVKESYPDPSDLTGKFVMVDVEAVRKFKQPVSLSTIKATPSLSNIALIKQSRLSVMPITPHEWDMILKLENSL